jgi:hypothetical protein
MNTTAIATLNYFMNDLPKVRFVNLPEGFGNNTIEKLAINNSFVLPTCVAISFSPYMRLTPGSKPVINNSFVFTAETLLAMKLNRALMSYVTKGSWSFSTTTSGPNTLLNYKFNYQTCVGTTDTEFITGCMNYLGGYNVSSVYPVDILYTLPKAWYMMPMTLDLTENVSSLYGHLNSNSTMAFYYGDYQNLNVRNICFGDNYDIEGRLVSKLSNDEVFSAAVNGTFVFERSNNTGGYGGLNYMLKMTDRCMLGRSQTLSEIGSFATGTYTTANPNGTKRRITVNNAFTFIADTWMNGDKTSIYDGLLLQSKTEKSEYAITKLHLECIGYGTLYNRDITKKYGRTYRFDPYVTWWTVWTDAWSSYEGEWLQMHANQPNCSTLRNGYLDYSNLGTVKVAESGGITWTYRRINGLNVNSYDSVMPMVNCIEIQNLFDWWDLRADIGMSQNTGSPQTTMFLDLAHGEMYGGTGDGRFFDTVQKSIGEYLYDDLAIYQSLEASLWSPVRRPYIQSNTLLVRLNVNGIKDRYSGYDLNFHWVMQNWRSSMAPRYSLICG